MEEGDLWSYVLVSSRRRHIKRDLLQCQKSYVLCLGVFWSTLHLSSLALGFLFLLRLGLFLFRRFLPLPLNFVLRLLLGLLGLILAPLRRDSDCRHR
jgi:hypothetical protein